MSAGKRFEEDFRLSAEKYPEIDINRLNDPVGGQAGVRNICDFILYSTPFIYYFELKSRQENTLNFKEITNTQWKGLVDKMTKPGAIPGILVHYSDHNEVYFVHMSHLVNLRDVQGKKSLHVDYARKNGTKLHGEVKRTRYTYDVRALLRHIGEPEIVTPHPKGESL